MISKKELQSILFIAAVTVAVLVVLDKLHFLSSISDTTTPVIESPISIVSIPRSPKLTQLPFLEGEKALATELTIKNLQQKNQFQKESLAQSNIKLPFKTTKTNKTNSILSRSITCDSSVHEKYSAPDLSSSVESLKWCKDTIVRDRVVIGRSWGSMSKDSQMRWDKIKCNELLSRGKLQTCDERWGWKSFDDWLSDEKVIVSGVSDVSCVVNIKTSTYCHVRPLGSEPTSNYFLNYFLMFSSITTCW
jgi:hypothetical protein